MESNHFSEELGEWQQVHSPFSTISAKLIDGENNSPAFPPGNHEDLPICSPCDDPKPINAPSPAADGDDGIRRWRRLHLGALQTGILEVFGRLRNCVTCRVGLWSFAWIAGGVTAAFLVLFWSRRVRIWWQNHLLGSSKETLLALLTEKDKKINQLLLQITQMNEMLLARRRVPVIRVK